MLFVLVNTINCRPLNKVGSNAARFTRSSTATDVVTRSNKVLYQVNRKLPFYHYTSMSTPYRYIV